jgi:Peroxidase
MKIEINLLGFVWQSGGPTWKVELGRYDALVSRSSDVDLPLATEDVPALMKRFSAQGLSVTDLVALSGTVEYMFYLYQLLPNEPWTTEHMSIALLIR